MVISADRTGDAEAFLKLVRSRYPEIKRVLTGDAAQGDGWADRHVESYSPERLLQTLRDLFPETSAALLGNEVDLQEKTGGA